MAPPRVKVEFSMTVNLGNFNSVRLGGCLEEDIESSENYISTYDLLYHKLRSKVLEELANLNSAIHMTYKDMP